MWLKIRRRWAGFCFVLNYVSSASHSLNGGVASDVQRRPFAHSYAVLIAPFGALRCFAAHFCSYMGRSLRDDIGIKIRASTIFIPISSLAELVK